MPNAVPTLDDSQSTRFAETVFRVVGSSRDGQELRLRSAKVTIGAAPGCTLRLRARGVQPVHCVVIRGRRATVVRAWSADTRLNGRAFQDACLRPGDRLTLGPIELEYIGSTQRLEAAPTGPAEASAPAASPKGTPEPRRTKPEQSRPATQQPGAQRRLAHAPHDDAGARPTAMADQHGGQPRSETPGQSERDRAWEEFHQQRRALEERMAELEKREEVLKRREEELTRHEAQLRADQTEYARQQAELDQKRSEIDAQQTELQRQRQRLENRQRELALREQSVGETNAYAQRQRELELRERSVAQQSQAVEERSNQLTQREEALQQREDSLGRQSEELQQRRKELEQRESRLDARQTPPPAEAAGERADKADKNEGVLGVADWRELTPVEAAPQTSAPDDAEAAPAEVLSVLQRFGRDETEPSPPSAQAETPRGRSQGPAAESEESVEEYMQNLLARLRGEEPKRSDSTPSHAKSPADTAHESRKPPASLGGSAVSPPGRRLPQRSPQPMEPSSAPERQVNLAAMREVANSSSSAAVNTYAKRRIRNAMRSRLSVAAVAAIAGAVLLYFWARWTPAVSVTFYAALVAFILAAFWAIQYGVLFVYWLRIRRALADSARGLSNQPELATRGEPSGDRPREAGESTGDTGDRREHQGEPPA